MRDTPLPKGFSNSMLDFHCAADARCAAIIGLAHQLYYKGAYEEDDGLAISVAQLRKCMNELNSKLAAVEATLAARNIIPITEHTDTSTLVVVSHNTAWAT